MPTHLFFLRRLSSLATVLGMALAMAAQTQASGLRTARLDGFTQADGSSVFALALTPSTEAVNGPRDIVVLVSTAASQTGEYRDKSLATLHVALAKLEPNDRVKLVVFDLHAVPLTHGFVAPNSPQMAAALAMLDRRTPLGACDLENALDAAAKSFMPGERPARAVVYIGDGASRANRLAADQLDRLADALVARARR